MQTAIASCEAEISAPQPSRQIYNFEAWLNIKENKKHIVLENTMWQNTALASQHDVYAIVVFTGIETRANLNSRKIPNKRGQFDIGLNNITKVLFLIMLVGTISLMWDQGFKDNGNQSKHFVIYMILLSYICSISLRTILDVAKIYGSYKF